MLIQKLLFLAENNPRKFIDWIFRQARRVDEREALKLISLYVILLQTVRGYDGFIIQGIKIVCGRLETTVNLALEILQEEIGYR